jgi:hypothetical protein
MHSLSMATHTVANRGSLKIMLTYPQEQDVPQGQGTNEAAFYHLPPARTQYLPNSLINSTPIILELCLTCNLRSVRLLRVMMSFLVVMYIIVAYYLTKVNSYHYH